MYPVYIYRVLQQFSFEESIIPQIIDFQNNKLDKVLASRKHRECQHVFGGYKLCQSWDNLHIFCIMSTT